MEDAHLDRRGFPGDMDQLEDIPSESRVFVMRVYYII